MQQYFSKLIQALCVGIPSFAISRGVVLHFNLDELVQRALENASGITMTANATGWLLSGGLGMLVVLLWFIFDLGNRLRTLAKKKQKKADEPREAFPYDGSEFPENYRPDCLVGDLSDGSPSSKKPISTKIRPVFEWTLKEVFNILRSYLGKQDANWVELSNPIQQALVDGEISARGKRMRFGESLGNKFTTPETPVPLEHWVEYGLRFGFADNTQKDPIVVFTERRDNSSQDDWIYRDLRFCEAEIRRKWSIKKPYSGSKQIKSDDRWDSMQALIWVLSRDQSRTTAAKVLEKTHGSGTHKAVTEAYEHIKLEQEFRLQHDENEIAKAIEEISEAGRTGQISISGRYKDSSKIEAISQDEWKHNKLNPFWGKLYDANDVHKKPIWQNLTFSESDMKRRWKEKR